MSRIIQPSVAKRITFATWARKEGFNRHSSATWTVPEGTEIPEALLAGAQIDGKAYEPNKPKRTRARKTRDRGPVEEPSPDIVPDPEPESFVTNKVDYPQGVSDEPTQEDD